MKQLCFSGLEAAINQALKLDPVTQERLMDLDGKVILIEISDWEIQCFLQPSSTAVNLYAEWDGNVDTTITSTLFGFIRISLNQADQASVFENSLQIRGDIQTGQQLRDILSHIDIDWEQHLANIIGDTPAHHLGKAARHVQQSLSQARHSLNRQISDYIHHEARLTPTRTELDSFCQQVNALRHAVERLEVRINAQQRDHS